MGAPLAAPLGEPGRGHAVSAGPRPSRAGGFTLLELTIALLLFALMAGVLFGSLRLAARSWDGGEAKAAQATEMRQTEQFLREHLSGQYPQRMRRVAQFPLLFEGSRDEVRYAASLPPRVRESGIHLFRLAVAREGERSRLVLERTLPDLNAPVPEASFANAERSVLAEDIAELRLEYYGRDADAAETIEPTWRDRWDDRQRLPIAMRIEIRPRKGPPWPLLLVAPRRAPEAGCRQWEPVTQRCAGQG
jgi:general secretion pathway protein J